MRNEPDLRVASPGPLPGRRQDVVEQRTGRGEAHRAYYDRKRAAGKRHNAALICLARRRVDVLYAMLRDGTPYQPQPAQAA